MSKEIVGKQCIFAKHFREYNNRKDAMLIRERIFYDDGTDETVVKMVYEPKRPFYVTSKPYRNHKQKKSVEEIGKLMRYESTDSNLATAVANALEKPYERRGLYALAESPYLYNTDYTVDNIWKRMYINKYPDYANKFLRVCNFDIETDATGEFGKVNESDEVKIITMDFGDKHYIGVTDQYLGDLINTDWKGKYFELIGEHLDGLLDPKNVTIASYPSERDLIIETFRTIHEWNPDILAIWNKNYDLPYIERRCDALSIHKGMLYKHKNVPKEYADYKYMEGPDKKFSETPGKGRPLKPAERHHYLICGAGFEIVDAMISYRLIRTGSKELPSYSLDAILAQEKLALKLKIVDLPGLTAQEWHVLMQAKYPIEYMAYASYDPRAMTLLDQKTKDLTLTLGSLIEECSYRYAHSSTKRVALDFAKHAATSGYVCASKYNYDKDQVKNMTSDERYELGLDYEVFDKKNWILTLPAFLASPQMGIRPFKDYPMWSTQIVIGCSDIDIVSSYPSVNEILNSSKETTVKEFIAVSGISEEDVRLNNLNLLCGKVSHLRYGIEMYNKLSIAAIADIAYEGEPEPKEEIPVEAEPATEVAVTDSPEVSVEEVSDHSQSEKRLERRIKALEDEVASSDNRLKELREKAQKYTKGISSLFDVNNPPW